MSNKHTLTEKITIWGIVQGVGFRPFVTKLAHRMDMNGYIKNMGGFVELTLNDPESKITEFIETIKREKPKAADIVRIKREKIQDVQTHMPDVDSSSGDVSNVDESSELARGFYIEQSEVRDDEIGMIPADMAICDGCIEEFYDPNNRRYKHPFISCTVCGPRYTIIDSLPYDRENTTMDEFPMCDFCKSQYNDSNTRRYHSQTISCNDCGPMPEYHFHNDTEIETITVAPHDSDMEKAAKTAVLHIKEGKVIALKGTGGYYFVCSPYHDEAVNTLRDIKIREEKPFAVMFKDTESIRNYCIINNIEEELLQSPKRPIVLLEKRAVASGSDFADGVCRSSRYIGAFLPSVGLQYQLIEYAGPLIMTSANLSDLPIIFKDDEMLNLLNVEPKLAGVLFNNRKIRMSLDDSVARVVDNKPQLTRRSKGYAPVPIYIEKPDGLDKTHHLFAAGGQLKSAFAMSKGNFSYISQHFGDLDTIESQSVYESNFYRMKKFFGIDPQIILCDMHPLYESTKFAQKYVEDENKLRTESRQIILKTIQHHHAHIASVMAEHGLDGQVIGVSFDGTGYGEDGNIWGGEFLICEREKYQRYAHLPYIDMIGGDSSMKEGWKSAISHKIATKSDLCNQEIDIAYIIDYSIRRGTLAEFEDQAQTIEAAIKNNVNTVQTSSMGRLFDAVSSLLGIHHMNRYEGECAIMLENAAYEALNKPGTNEANDLALMFHDSVAQYILNTCLRIKKSKNIDQVALSGGVFQNKILTEKSLKYLRKEGFKVYLNGSVPPNDGGIALGQNYIGMHYMSGREDGINQERK